jgi:hypothetical protein
MPRNQASANRLCLRLVELGSCIGHERRLHSSRIHSKTALLLPVEFTVFFPSLSFSCSLVSLTRTRTRIAGSGLINWLVYEDPASREPQRTESDRASPRCLEL